MMEINKNNEILVRKLYEKYPYPNRELKKQDLKKYSNWLTKELCSKEEVQKYWQGKKVLELGCGTGELSIALANEGAIVKAIDFSKNSIKIAIKNSKKLCKNNFPKFFVKNILKYKPKEKFDVVIALGSLHHTINAKKGFKTGANCLKKNGIIIVGLYNKYSRFRHRIKRFILWLLAGKNIEKRIDLGIKLFGKHKTRNQSADKYGQIHESYHSINEVLKWFNEENIEFVSSKPTFEKPVIDEIKWLLRKQNAFFIMVGKKKANLDK